MAEVKMAIDLLSELEPLLGRIQIEPPEAEALVLKCKWAMETLGPEDNWAIVP